MKIIRSFILLLASLLAGALSPSRSAFAMGAFETTGNVRWVVFASRQNLDEAIGLARRFGSDFGPPMVFSSTSGWYAIVAGPLSVYDPAALKKRLADLWWPPKDTSLAKGQTLVEEVWKAPGSPVLATASSATGTHVASARGLDVRVHTRRDISVRTGGHEMIKVKFDDDGPNTSAAVQIVQLDSSSPFPQVVATHFTGGAHCCTVMKVLTFVGNRWETIDVGEFDSEGPQIEDLLGNGSAELVGKDESFDYTFASYADSNAPPKVFRLAGDRILDVSHSAEFRRPILQMLLADQGLATPDMWRNNGYLAGWVAHSALVGNGAEAWSKMLNLYDRNSDWDLSTCAKDDNPCPDYEKRQRDFPTALREHLAQTGYSLDSVASASVGATSPSFDCNKAQTPSEIQICRSPRLAELDNILAAGYAFIKTTQGRPAADEIGVWYWKLIAHCEGGEDCIARRQTEEISALARAGAPVALPSWASAPAPSEQQPTSPSPPPAPETAKTVDEAKPPVKQDAETTAGTGFLVTSDGELVTNAHVVENCSDVRVTTDQQATASARVIARDSRNDLALLSSTLITRKSRVAKASARRTKRAKAQPALILAGHGVSLRVENGALTIQNGFTHYPQKREIFRYFRGDVALPERIILLDGSGSISFDVLSWLAEQKVSFIRIDWKGDIVCVAGASGYSANPHRVRWQLETRENPEQRNDFCRSIIMRKIEATIITLEKSIPRSDKWERAMRSAYAGLSRLEENPPETISELRALEANCAASYFRSWVGMPIKWRAPAAGQFQLIGIP